MSEGLDLLDDEAVRRFVIEGVMVIPSGLPAHFHARMVKALDETNRATTNPRSRILDAVPDLHIVNQAPPVRGALVSLLGKNARMHPYTVSHCNPPGTPGELWHQDSAFDRPSEPWRLTLFYYPTAVTNDMGPTVVVPGTQYRRVSNIDLHRYGRITSEQRLTVNAGDVVLMHYDLWHRGTSNTSQQTRYMVKMVFERVEAPRAPSWRAGDDSLSEVSLSAFRRVRVAVDNETEAYRHQERWISIWKWLHGESSRRDGWFPQYLP